MSMEKFRAPVMPNPPIEWDPQYMRQFIRALELYFGQLDSLTPQQAESYRADRFIGGELSGRAPNYTTAERTALTLTADDAGTTVFDTDLGKLCVWVGAAWETITSV